ncbi:MFS transporter [Streptomyces sp. NBC_01693]|uniref:MFS transporter n=1 Tax=unclassified Streptomyces TaxID=2593676 RepID=UPI002E369726|nr:MULTISPECIES: MFS transporter [unclassified Streptomyces]
MSSTSPQTNPRRWAALLFISIAQLMVILDSAIMNIALPSAQSALHFSDGGRQWVITAYGLAFGGLLILGGRLSDVLGRKRTFTIGLVGFALASAVGGAATNLGVLLIARAGQGVFGALLAPSALSLISLTFTNPRERAKAFGIFGAIATAGGAIGLLLGGVLTQYLNWRWSMLVNIPIAVIGIIGALTVVQDVPTEGKRTRLDIPGAVLASLGLVALVFGFSEAESQGWTSGLTVMMFVASVVLLIAFVALEAKIKSPLLPLHILTERNRAGSYLSVALAVISMFGMFLFLSYYLQLVKGFSPSETGVAFLPLAAAQAIGSMVIATRLSSRVRPGVLMSSGYLVTAVGVLLLALLQKDTSYELLAIAEVITGLGIGTAFMPAMSLGTHGVDPQYAGVASAMVGASQQIGGSVGTALLNTIAASSTAAYLLSHAHSAAATDAALVHGFSTAYWWAVGFLVLSAVVSLAAVNAPRPNHDTAAGEPAKVPEMVV